MSLSQALYGVVSSFCTHTIPCLLLFQTPLWAYFHFSLFKREFQAFQCLSVMSFLFSDSYPIYTVTHFTHNVRLVRSLIIKKEKMVIAKYKGSYGTYTAFEARLFEMTDVKPLN